MILAQVYTLRHFIQAGMFLVVRLQVVDRLLNPFIILGQLLIICCVHIFHPLCISVYSIRPDISNYRGSGGINHPILALVSRHDTRIYPNNALIAAKMFNKMMSGG
jgi:hypothetical protein